MCKDIDFQTEFIFLSEEQFYIPLFSNLLYLKMWSKITSGTK